ncbi:MAG: hypothetical protein WC453_00305 [Patescibacteria group bacterium]
MAVLTRPALDRAAIIKREIFYFFTGLAVTLVVLETLWPDIILVYFNLNWLWLLWLLSALSLLIKKSRPNKE